MLVREFAAGIAFVGCIARDPEVLGRETAARGHVAVFLRQHHRRRLHHQLVPGRPADAVGHVGIDDLPVAPGAAVGLARRVLFARQHSAVVSNTLPCGLSLPKGRGMNSCSVTLLRSPSTIMCRRALKKCWCVGPPRPPPPCRPTDRLAGRHRRGLDDASQLGFELDRAVLIEVPVEAVIVIADGREERDHEPARAPHLKRLVAEFVVLPEDAVILLMQADRVLHDRRLAVIVGDRHVEIMDMAEAIAAELQRVGELAETVFAGVERALPEMVRRRSA